MAIDERPMYVVYLQKATGKRVQGNIFSDLDEARKWADLMVSSPYNAILAFVEKNQLMSVHRKK